MSVDAAVPVGQATDGLDLRHLISLSDEVGLFEHALGAVPRTEHGYCVDDVARAVVVLCREPDPSATVTELAGRYVTFLINAQGPDGRFHNRLGYDGHWQDESATGDWWGRALWGLGTAAARGAGPWVREVALAGFNRGAGHRPHHMHSMAFAALGAAEILAVDPAHDPACRLLADAATSIVGFSPFSPFSTSGPAADAPGAAVIWPWPQDRLTYANAVLPEVLIAAGHTQGDHARTAFGLRLLGWLVATETSGGHFSPTPARGWKPGEARPGFDQQPIEIAALADACARAFAITGDPRWSRTVRMAAAWFEGENDARTPMWNPATGGGYDGLTATGRNENQGAESTLALLTTRQQYRRLRMATR